jgi:predicted CXXCH cytochrome family protein
MTHRDPQYSPDHMAGNPAGYLHRSTVVVAALVLANAVSGSGNLAGEHPTLVSVEATDCTACHEDLLQDMATVHAIAAEDCTACHDVAIAETGTTITLAEEEPALCVMCHDDLDAAVQGNLAAPHYPVTDSCLNCHSPHASEQPSLLTISVRELCATCHDAGPLGETHGGQLTDATECIQCHRPHGSENAGLLNGARLHAPFADGSCSGCHREPFGNRIRLRKRGERLCEACHGKTAQGPGDAGSVHAALHGEKGRAGCLSCHDPHLSDAPKLLVRSAPELCEPCHADVVATAVSETGHVPAADDCLNCHVPHVSAETALLIDPAEQLCRACHDLEADELVQAHLGADMEALQCLDCHTPHGGDHAALLAEYLHAPVVDGCDTCHDGAADALFEQGESPLCLNCHDDVGELADAAQVPHPAMELARCADCHNPHASAQPRLVKRAGGAECLACHDAQAPSTGEFAHGAIGWFGCEACHLPHGGDRERLLRAPVDELCLGCHDPRTVKIPDDGSDATLLDRFGVSPEQAKSLARLRLSADGVEGHPVAGHRVSGVPTRDELRRTDSTFEGEMSCLTCHDPHKGRSSDILRWDAESPMAACIHCHPK